MNVETEKCPMAAMKMENVCANLDITVSMNVDVSLLINHNKVLRII